MGEKVEQSCFLCLQSLTQNRSSDEQINLTKLFFKYLKSKHEIKAFVCGKCGESLTEFVKLYNTLEKVRLKMDYLLESIKDIILNSNHSKPANFRVAFARGIVLEKCLEQMGSKRLHINLERLDTSQIKKEGSSPILVSDCPDEYLTNCNNESASISNDSVEGNNTPNTLLCSDNRWPQIILERLDLSKLIDRRSLPPTSDCSDNWTPNLDDVSTSNDETELHPGVTLPRKPHITKRSEGENGSLRADDCSEKMEARKPHFIPEGIDTSRIKKEKVTNSNDDDGNGTPSTPVVNEIVDVKCGVGCANNAPTKNKNKGMSAGVKCPKCLKTFGSKSHLKIHNDAVHLRLKPFKCPTCLKAFFSERKLRGHINAVHLRLKPYKCDMCDKACSYDSDLLKHKRICYMQKRNEDLRIKPFKCPTCFKPFPTRAQIKHHINAVHLRIKPFKCLTCSKPFPTRAQIKNHINAVHLRLKPYKCDICDRSFATFCSLKRHKLAPHKPKVEVNLKVQHDSKLFPCAICKKTFATEKLLQRHNYRVHTTTVRVPCKRCDKIFKDRTDMERHVAAVHEKKREYCQVPSCNKNYSYLMSLINHYRSAHPDFVIPQSSNGNTQT